MDQIYNGMLYMVQAAAEHPQTAEKNVQTQGRDDFRKLMDQKRQPAQKKDDAADSSLQASAGETSREGAAAAAGDIQELERQMTLAAMAMLQNPVVPAEQAVPDSGKEAGAVTVEAEMPLLAVVGGDTEKYADTADGKVISMEEQAVTAGAETAGQAGIFREPVQQAEEAVPAQVREVPSAEAETEAGEAQAAETPKTEEADEPRDIEAETPVFRNVREIPVKVGEAPAAEETHEMVPVEKQIGQRLAEAVKTGDTRVEIQLTPANLGKVTVEVTLGKDGALHVALHAERSETRDLLAKSADGLMAMLSRESRQEVQVEVPRRQESQQQDFYDGRQGSDSHSRQQQERRREDRRSGEDFLHQLRLGLVPVDGETA